MGAVRKRILLLLCAVAVLFILGIAGWQMQEGHRIALLYKQTSSDTGRTADKLVELRGEKLANLSTDYSNWDDMVVFVKTRDPKWAEVNLVTGMGTYGADAIAVYNPIGVRTYAVDSSGNASLRLPHFGPEQIKGFFSAGPLCHFFLQTRRGLLEVRGANIVPSADWKRTGPSHGYFLASRIWNSGYLDGVASMLDGKASLQPVSAGSRMMPGERKQSVIVFRKSLRGSDGRSLQTLCVTKRFEQGDIQRAASRRTIILLGLFAGMMIVGLALGLSRFVAHPLGLISSAMETPSPDTLSHLENETSEFGRLATLIRKFFDQKVALEEETRVRARAEEDAKRSEQNLSTTLNSISDGFYSLDENLVFTYFNSAAETMLRRSQADVIGKNMFEVFPKLKGSIFDINFALAVKDKVAVSFEAYGATSDHWYDVRVYPQLNGISVYFQDVTDQKQAEETLADRERRYRSLWESATEGLCLHELITDADGVAVNYRILDVNPAYESALGVKASDIVGKLATEAYGTTEPRHLEEYARVAQTGVPERFETIFQRMGRHFSISVFSPSPGQFATALLDISERKTHEDVLAHQATHDTLTGLPNRHYFEQHLSELITGSASRKSRSMTVLFLDLDKFKLINDTLGHKVGDLLLIETGERLQSCLRSDDLLARMGGDEFTVILPRCRSRSIAGVVASRMIDSISRPFDIQGHKFVIGASIGLASYPSDGADTVSLLKHADAAMYKAKQAGRGTFRWFTGDVDVDNEQRANMEMDIRSALEKGQFNVYYQPIVSLEDGNILVAEALLRWDHPDKGMISPSLLIPIAEEIGLIGQIGDYVLRTACAQTMAWRDEGIHLSQIGVNLSTAQVRDASWLDSVSAALSDTGLDARCLSLEVTETDFAADYESMRKILHEVQERGIGIAIDDFGIGQSSLSRLKDFPVIHLKIDGSFVRDIEHNESDNALVRSIVEIAHGQGIQVTAEWVATESQMEILRQIGCDFAQGYFISPALPADKFRKFAAQRAQLAKRNLKAA